MESRPQPVTFDVNVLVAAVVGGNTTFSTWPSPPPAGPNPAAECVGIVNDVQEFTLSLSPHVLRNTIRVLSSVEGFGWAEEHAEENARVLVSISRASGADIVEPRVHVSDCTDYEDNRILELAIASGSILVVSSDSHLLDMSPWRGIPIIKPRDFVGRVDVMRRSLRGGRQT